MRRLIRSLFLVAALAALSACATYPSGDYYRYGDRPYYDRDGDYAYSDARRGYVAYGDDYWRDTWWPYYSTVLYPFYSAYYDPWYAPGFYYGVTYYPHYHAGLAWGPRYGWPSYGFAYSPYRWSWWDNYYDWSWHGHHHRGRDDWRDRGGRHDAPRFGSARNEAERLAAREAIARPQRESFRPQGGAGPYADGYREPGTPGIGRPYDRRRDPQSGDDGTIATMPGNPARAPGSVGYGRDRDGARDESRPMRVYQQPWRSRDPAGGLRQPSYRGDGGAPQPRIYRPSQPGGGYSRGRDASPGQLRAPQPVYSPSPRMESRPNAGGFSRPSGGGSSPSRGDGGARSSGGSRSRDNQPD